MTIRHQVNSNDDDHILVSAGLFNLLFLGVGGITLIALLHSPTVVSVGYLYAYIAMWILFNMLLRVKLYYFGVILIALGEHDEDQYKIYYKKLVSLLILCLIVATFFGYLFTPQSIKLDRVDITGQIKKVETIAYSRSCGCSSDENTERLISDGEEYTGKKYYKVTFDDGSKEIFNLYNNDPTLDLKYGFRLKNIKNNDILKIYSEKRCFKYQFSSEVYCKYQLTLVEHNTIDNNSTQDETLLMEISPTTYIHPKRI